MSANSFGNRFVITSFGESHGTALGVVIDGCPAGVKWDAKILERELERRRPGSSTIVSARNEGDVPEILSGVHEGKTLGTPIAMIVRNTDQRSGDYAAISKSLATSSSRGKTKSSGKLKAGTRAGAARTGHADDMWREKFGHSDIRGGGRSSGRETVSRVMAGAVAQMLLKKLAPRLKVTGFAREIGPFALSDEELMSFSAKNKGVYPADAFPARYPSKKGSAEVEKLLLSAKEEGLSYGGVAEIWVDGVPKGLGQPVFHKIKADLAAACMSVGATIGFEIGEGFASAWAEGSEFHTRQGGTQYGGIRGGITTGERLMLRVAFKPTSSVLDVAKKGRHDPCIVPRAIPVLEAMAYIVLADHLLWARTDR